jgi:hypothetical protein
MELVSVDEISALHSRLSFRVQRRIAERWSFGFIRLRMDYAAMGTPSSVSWRYMKPPHSALWEARPQLLAHRLPHSRIFRQRGRIQLRIPAGQVQS